jgi:hypothetical protein
MKSGDAMVKTTRVPVAPPAEHEGHTVVMEMELDEGDNVLHLILVIDGEDIAKRVHGDPGHWIALTPGWKVWDSKGGVTFRPPDPDEVIRKH